MSTFHQRSTCHLHKLQVLKPGLWPWRPSLHDLRIQKCALCLQAVELLKFSLRNTQHMPCSWLPYHQWCQVIALGRALVFWSENTCHAAQAEESMELAYQWPGSGPELASRNVWAWVSPLFLGLHFLTWQVITWTLMPLPSLKHLWLYDFTIQQDNGNLLQSPLRASLDFYWFLDTVENVTLQKIIFGNFFTSKNWLYTHSPTNLWYMMNIINHYVPFYEYQPFIG